MASARNLNRQLWPELYDHAFPTKTTRSIGKVQVHRWRMAGDSGTGYEEYQYAVYVPIESYFDSPFSTLTTGEGGVKLGQYGSQRLTAALEALPVKTNERYERVLAYIIGNQEQAYAYILDAYPEAASGHRSNGRISLTRRCKAHKCTMTCYSSEAHEHVLTR